MGACSGDDAPTPIQEPEPTSFCYLQEQVVTSDSLKTKVVYTYNDQNQVIETAHVENDKLVATRTYEYNSAGRLSRENYFGPDNEQISYTVYSYNPQGRLSRYVVWQQLALGVNHRLATFQAQYNINGSLQAATDFNYLDNQQKQTQKISFTYPVNGPVSVAVSKQVSSQSYNATFTTDSLRAPLSSVPAFYIKRPGIGYPGKNNLLSLTATNTAKEDVADVSYTTAYTYNDKGYPTRADMTYNNGKTVTYTYSYRCE
ncbi:hypothetical protein GCM10028895_04820 [Pontibacter rugosus]